VIDATQSTPGLSQRRVLLFLAENGPTDPYRLHWLSRAASATWWGTLSWCRSAGWIDLSTPGVVAITAAGREQLTRNSREDDRIRSEFRDVADPYWIAREAKRG
jgi:hypothetical protein